MPPVLYQSSPLAISVSVHDTNIRFPTAEMLEPCEPPFILVYRRPSC